MASRRQPHLRPDIGTKSEPSQIGSVRIIGGEMRGRSLHFPTDSRLRPMKDRIREALFNLIGPTIRGSHAVDLFAGTGALGFEALSRGALRATFIERHVPTSKLLRQNAQILAVTSRISIVASDTFVWAKRQMDLGTEPCVLFCSPPYELYQSRREDMRQLLQSLVQRIPENSLVAVEFDEQFTADALPSPDAWQIRSYAGIHLALQRVVRTERQDD